MDRDYILHCPNLLKRFCKDTGTPINVYHEPYFEERLETLDIVFGCKKKFELFVSELESFFDVQEYFEYYNSLKDKVISTIKENPFFQEFNNQPVTWEKKYPYPSKDFYKMPLDRKSVISIDMKKANFSALSVFDKRIFNADTWEEFLSRFTPYEHLIGSKYVRQVIMGTCNPKRQVSYEKYLMGELLDYIQERVSVEVFSFSSDEIILLPMTPLPSHSLDKIQEIVATWKYGHIIRVSLFTLFKLPVTDGWRRKIFDGEKTTFDFKKMSADYYHQAVKMEMGEHITMDDLVIYHDGRLARFLSPIF